MKKILIISQTQFGYQIDYYMYSKYLKDIFEITFLCWDYNKPKISFDNVNIYYVSRKGNIAVRNIRFIYEAIRQIKKVKFHTIFIDYFRGASLLKIFAYNENYILDVRTGSVANSITKRFIYNKLLLYESFFFNRITIISESLSGYLGINKNKTKLLPLGADVLSSRSKCFEELKLLYVGTFNNRHLEKTIEGLNKFYFEYSNKVIIHYTIIGSGREDEERKIKEKIAKYNLENVVKLLGYIHHHRLKPYFDTHNLGIVFIPKEQKYEYQPPTKLFEYLMSGMPVLATKTFENKRIVNENNGILIDDTEQGVYEGLKKFSLLKKNFDSSNIRKSVEQFSWSNIIKKFLLPILNEEFNNDN